MVSRGRVERLMRHHGIWARMRRQFRVRTTDSHHDLPIAPNLLEQTLVATRPNQIWLANITCVPTSQRGLYLAVVLDPFTHKIAGWAMRGHMWAELDFSTRPTRRAASGRTPLTDRPPTRSSWKATASSAMSIVRGRRGARCRKRSGGQQRQIKNPFARRACLRRAEGSDGFVHPDHRDRESEDEDRTGESRLQYQTPRLPAAHRGMIR